MKLGTVTPVSACVFFFASFNGLAACGGPTAPAQTPSSEGSTAPPDGKASPPEPSQAGTPSPGSTPSTAASGAGESSKTTPSPAPPSASTKGEPGRTAEDIRNIIVARRDEFRLCYDMRLKGNPTMEGMIDVRWTIDPKGVVADVSVDESKSDIADASVTRCLGNVLRRIKFAESPKGLETKAHYPFHFNPRSGGRVAGQDGGT